MKFIIDTNVYIHFNLFTECDWKTLIGDEDLTLLITPTILREIDKLKNDPRGFVNRRARRLGSIFDRIEEGKSTSSGIKMDFLEQSTKDFDWDQHNLERSAADDNIIAETLMAKYSSGEEICIITADSLLKRKAKAHRIRFLAPPERWRKVQNDPKDEHIRRLESLVKETIPEVKLCFQGKRNCEESLAITIGDPAGGTLTEKLIEEQIAKMKSENTRKVECLREESRMGLDDLKNIFSNFAYRFEEKSDNYLINKYRKDLDEYLISYKRVLEERILIMVIPLVLRNVGAIPAENIDIIVKFPQDVVPVGKLQELPEEPKIPSKFETSNESMESILAQPYPILPSISGYEIPVEENFLGPMVDKSKGTIKFWIKSLKHNFIFRLTIYAKFHQGRKAHPFHIDYRISLSNHPEIIAGKLLLEIKQKD